MVRLQTQTCRGCYGVWNGHVHTTILKTDNQRGLLYGFGTLHRMLCGSLDGGEFQGEWMHVYVWRAFAVHLKLLQTANLFI